MIPLRRLVIGLLLALFVGLAVAPGACLLIGVPPFGLVNPIAAAATYFLFTRWPRVVRMVMRDAERLAAPDALDVPAMRRQAHQLGLPFPEADGSMSWPKPESANENLPAAMRARRLAAEGCQTCGGRGDVAMFTPHRERGTVYFRSACPACRETSR